MRRRAMVVAASGLVLGLAAPAAADPVGGTPFQVNSYTTDDQSGAVVCQAADGRFAISWESFVQDAGTRGVYAQRFTADGAPAGTEFQVNVYTTGNQIDASICCDDAGGFVVVWRGTDAGSGGVVGRRFDAAGAPVGTEFQVNTYFTGNQQTPRVACNGRGDFAVVWTSVGQDGDGFGIYAQRFSSTGAPVGTEFRVGTYTTGTQDGGTPALDADGGLVVVWEDEGRDGGTEGVFGRRFDSSGAPAGAEFQVNAYTTSRQFEPSIGLDGTGRFVVTWTSEDQDGDAYGVFARCFAADAAPLGTEFQVNAYTTGIQRANQWQALAVDRGGGFVVTWFSTQPEDPDGGVLARRFASDGTPLGTEFRVDTTAAGVQYEGAVAADADGDFVVAWRSDLGVDGDGYGVAARVFKDPCGDGAVGAGESCDDGSRLPGDCCSPACAFEAGGTPCDADGVDCTADGCDGAGTCTAGVPDDGACPACRVCDATNGCIVGPAGAACDADGVACTPDACDGAGTCTAGAPDHDACPACRICDATAGCVARPRTDCLRPTRARAAVLTLTNKSTDARDRASFTWRRGAALALADLGTPTADTPWDLCVFDRAGDADRLVLDARAAGGSGWKTRGKKGFRYRRKDGAPEGLTDVDLRSGADGKARASAEGKGSALALPAFPLVPPLTAELRAGNAGACVAATFAAPKKNTATRVKAKGE